MTLAARRLDADARAAMIDAERGGAERHRQGAAERGDQRAITFAHAPVEPAILVADIVLDRQFFQFDRVAPGADRLEKRVPAPARDQHGRSRPVFRRFGGAAHRPAMRLARGKPVGLFLEGTAAVAQPRRPLRPFLVKRKPGRFGQRRDRVAVGRMEPFAAEIAGNSVDEPSPGAPADALARLQQRERRGRRRQPAPRPDAGGAGADHRDIDLGRKLRHRRLATLSPRR